MTLLFRSKKRACNVLTGRDAAQVAALVRRLLETRLRTAERRSARPER